METNHSLSLWYRQPASCFEEALPLGNGRLGAMVFGGVQTERITLNEDTLWSGYPKPMAEENLSEHYKTAQRLAKEKKFAQAQTHIEQHLLGPFTQSYMPLCDLLIDFPDPEGETEYRRSLSLSNAVCLTELTVGGIKHFRETFVSSPGQAMCMRLFANRKGQISFTLRLDCKLRHTVTAEEGRLTLKGLCPSHVVPSYIECVEPVVYLEDDRHKGMRFAACALVEAKGGSHAYDNGTITVKGADSAVIRLMARTSFNGFEKHPFLEGRNEEELLAHDLKAVSKTSYGEAKAQHIKDHSALFHRVNFDLGPDKYACKPTDERLRSAYPGDNGLCALLFQYGRYLLIASSRKDTQPANLQGIWNEHLRPIWSCNYTININTQMNYWPAESCNLSELHEPLFDLVEGLVKTGKETARLYYGARGAVSHHNTDLWQLSNPVGEKNSGFAGCSFFPMSLGWLCAHLMEHYRFTDDCVFLRKRALPALREAARFYLDILTEDEDGSLIMTPATSPENVLTYEGKTVKVAREATMNNAIVREVLASYLQALNDLNMHEEMEEEAAAALPRLRGYRIGSQSQILEWDEEYEEPEPHHRHLSHLYGLYPGHEITAETAPELINACRRTLCMRGGDGTGWSLAWKACFHARLQDGDKALSFLHRQLTYTEPDTGMNLQSGGTYLNLLCAHPPFQIDGNFGMTAAIAQMLLGFRGDSITLLPALPKAWQKGCVKGLRAPHCTEVNMMFESGKLIRAEIFRNNQKPLTVKYLGKTVVIPENAPEIITLNSELCIL